VCLIFGPDSDSDGIQKADRQTRRFGYLLAKLKVFRLFCPPAPVQAIRRYGCQPDLNNFSKLCVTHHKVHSTASSPCPGAGSDSAPAWAGQCSGKGANSLLSLSAWLIYWLVITWDSQSTAAWPL